jgi:23S rRNA pseudouridine1911/1915/1917 synthase
VHLASIGHPCAGDAVYGKTCSGDARLDAFGRQALHAWRLALIHPVSGEEVSWESPLPADFTALLDALRADV